jgi:poly(hydroxyalkanoate) depolymerase family esterase
MNRPFREWMSDAARFTQGGQLQAATDAIQKALRAAPAAAAAAATAVTTPSAGAGTVIDVEARVVRTEAGAATADRRTDASGVKAEEAARAEAGPRAAGGEQWTDGEFKHGGRTLAYKLYVPPAVPGAPAAAPGLILMLHGCTQGPDDFAVGTQMNAQAREAGFAVLYPAQTQHANSQKCWNWFKPQHQQRGRGEPALLAALAQRVATQIGADPARVYVAGLSAGGAMADILGRCYPDVFAAVGVHSGLPRGAANDVMSALKVMRSGTPAIAGGPGPVPPMIVFHGDADTTVHPSNGAAVVDAAGRRAIDAQGSAEAPQVTPGRSPGGRGFTRTAYPATGNRGALEHWQLQGVGHAWSGGNARGSYTEPKGPDASAEMLRFFIAHPAKRSGTPS